MARQPKVLFTEEGAAVAEKIGARKAAALIRNKAREEEVVSVAMAELYPNLFFELLKRTRDRGAARIALNCIRQARDPLLPDVMSPIFEMLAAPYHAMRGQLLKQTLREEVFALRIEALESFRDRKIRRRIRKYSEKDFHWLVVFIGHGDDVHMMNGVLHECNEMLTYRLGKWLEHQRDLLTRTPEEIRADQKAKRDRNRLYWDPSYDPAQALNIRH